jgi:predicted Zn-dependent protease
MKLFLAAMLIAVPALAGAQGLLDFRTDLAFDASAVEAVAERSYRARLGKLATDGRLDASTALLARLREAVARLRPAAELERPGAAAIAWEIHTCRRCDENASAMAGGKLLVGEEFIAGLALTDDELTFLIAHEMAHVLAEHTREFATAARYFLGNGRHRDYEDIQNELDESIGAYLRMAPIYAGQELDADYIGFILGARSGHDPDAMPRLLHKLHNKAATGFMNHPDPVLRIQRVHAMLQAAHRIHAMHANLPGRF